LLIRNKNIMKKTLLTILALVLILVVGYFLFSYSNTGEELVGEQPETKTEEGIIEETTTIKVYFSNSKEDPEILYCERVYPVEREILKVTPVAQTEDIIKKALEELLKGPNRDELEEGYFTNINPGVEIQSLTVKDGIARVDFSEELEYQLGGSCRVQAIRAQITETIKQFSEIQEVIISVDGKVEDVLQP